MAASMAWAQAVKPPAKAVAAPSGPKVWLAREIAEFFHAVGILILEGYGLTETCPVLTFNRPSKFKFGSVGQALPGVELAIAPDGEILGRGANIATRGYFKQPEVTVQAFRDLWYHTGDLGRMDEDGYLFFVDRKKDAIRRRGENISSFEIERVIDRLEQVLESAAVGVPSEHGEEEVKLSVVLQPGAALTAEELWAYCDEELPAFMVPRFLEFREALPRTDTERVRKFALRDEGIHAGVLDREAVRA